MNDHVRAQRGALFRELHHRAQAFVIPNPWDIGTAVLLAGMGFEALATTSAGYAYAQGQPDNNIRREEMLSHAATLGDVTGLPVSADLEHGFADDPAGVAETIRLAGAAGLAGASIEDARAGSIYARGQATERIRAAAEAARALPYPFTLTARAENYITGRPDLGDTIQRLQHFQDAGADVLYAPGLKTRDDIRAVVRNLDKPVNVVMGFTAGPQLSVEELTALGVKRISVGSALSRTALSAFLGAATEIKVHGTFAFAQDLLSTAELNKLFGSSTVR